MLAACGLAATVSLPLVAIAVLASGGGASAGTWQHLVETGLPMQFLGLLERGAGTEVPLTDAMAKLIGQVPFHGLRYEGRRFDCGDKIGFLEAQIAFALKRPDMAPAVQAFLKNYC